MKAIILAAGRGSRLGKLTEDKPKCMLEFGTETILERQIRILGTCGICEQDIIVVAGYKKEYITERIQATIISNDVYQSTDNSYSLSLALQDMDDDVLVLDGDLVFTAESVDCLLKSQGNALLGMQEAEHYGSTGISTNGKTGYVTGVGKHISSKVIYASMMKIVQPDLKIIREQLKMPGMEKTWYTVPVNHVIGKITFHLTLTDAKVRGVNTYFEYIEAKRF